MGSVCGSGYIYVYIILLQSLLKGVGSVFESAAKSRITSAIAMIYWARLRFD